MGLLGGLFGEAFLEANVRTHRTVKEKKERLNNYGTVGVLLVLP